MTSAMPVLQWRIPYANEGEQFRIWYLTDLHLGSAACDEPLLIKIVKRIEAANDFWFFGGDAFDNVYWNDPRFRPSVLDPRLRGLDAPAHRLVQLALDLLAPIAPNCLGLACGNHEDALLKHNGIDTYGALVRGIAAAKGCKPTDLALGYEGYIRLLFDRNRHVTAYNIYAHHGAGGGRKAGGDALRLEEMLQTHSDADIAVMGHRHSGMMVVPKDFPCLRRRGDQTEVYLKRRWGVEGGSFLKSYQEPDEDGMPILTYPQLKQLPPRVPGCMYFDITPHTRQVSFTPVMA